jgi:hypothetical protein
LNVKDHKLQSCRKLMKTRPEGFWMTSGWLLVLLCFKGLCLDRSWQTWTKAIEAKGLSGFNVRFTKFSDIQWLWQHLNYSTIHALAR